jgi:hypothetical protein
MYTINTKETGIEILFNGKNIGTLTCTEPEATHMIRMLNTHPLADEE